jgi:hypothetical protein
MKPYVIIALYAVSAVVMLACIKLLLHFTLADNSTAQQVETEPPAELLRCLVLYGQRLLIVASLSIDWPVSIAYPLRAVALVWSSSSPETLSADCILPANSSVPLAVQLVVFYLAIPIVMLMLHLLIEVMLTTRCLVRSMTPGTAQKLLPRLGSSAMVVLFFFLPSLQRTVFGLFACIPLDQPASWPYQATAVGSFWVYDTSTVCFGTGWHRYLALGLGVPLIAVFCVVLPGFIVLITVPNTSKLYDAAFLRRWGFLTHAYRPSCCWWEAVVVWETAALVAISVFGVNVGAFYQCVLMIVALMLISHLQLGFKPYAHMHAGKAMLQGTHCLLLTTLSGLTFLPVGAVQPGATYGLVMGGILVAVHTVYVCSVLWRLVKTVNWPLLCNALERCSSALNMGMQYVRLGAARAWVQSGLPRDRMPPSLIKGACGAPSAALGHVHGAGQGKHAGGPALLTSPTSASDASFASVLAEMFAVPLPASAANSGV